VTALLLSVHVLAAIVLIGPVTAAASLFPRYGREAAAAPDPAGPGPALGTARALHRISAGYGLVGVVVPVFGIATAARMGVLDEAWLWVSMALTALAAALLAAVIVPAQRRVLRGLDGLDGLDGLGGTADPDPDVGGDLRRLSMVTGLFALTWAVVVVLMIVRPGSTTGV
jgi:hypothetical protein